MVVKPYQSRRLVLDRGHKCNFFYNNKKRKHGDNMFIVKQLQLLNKEISA